ncbi:MAG: polysaccharide biosynthesis C-terminal domain-containing protein, partial [Chloroflexi bacterium]|nr:polysaccharide biosynthesis C-terminal domain-containing protein [Chloroflexota bacterium]
SLVLSATGHTRPLVWGIVIAFAVNLPISIAFASFIGPAGPAVGTVASVVCAAAYFARASRKHTGLHPLSCFPWRMAGTMTLFSAAACGAVWAVRYLPVRTEIGFAAALGGFSLLLVAILLRSRLLTSYERTTLGRWMSPAAWLRFGKTPGSA